MAMEGVIDLLVNAGMTRSDASMALDIGRHAMDEAVTRVASVCAMAPNRHIAEAAYIVALRGLEVNIGNVLKEGKAL